MCEPVGQLAVIGQDNQAGGIGVESADAKDTLVSTDKINGLFPAARITVRTDDALGLIQKKIDFLCRANFFAEDGK